MSPFVKLWEESEKGRGIHKGSVPPAKYSQTQFVHITQRILCHRSRNLVYNFIKLQMIYFIYLCNCPNISLLLEKLCFLQNESRNTQII